MTSQPTTASDDVRRPVQAYLSRVLRLNPLQDPQAVLAERRRALGLKAVNTSLPGSSLTPRSHEKRRQVGDYVTRLQNDFWTMPLDQLRHSINAIDVREMPELRPTMARLRTAASCRGEFPRLTTVPNADLPLIHAFKSVVVRPAGDAGPIRERFLRSIRDRDRLKKVQRMVKFIKQEYPMLFQLEKNWFETILTMNRRSVASATAAGGDSGGLELSIPYWLIVVVVIVIRVLFSFLR